MAKKEKKPFSLKKEVMEWMETLVWATVAVILVFTFVARTAVVSGSSMLPTYHDADPPPAFILSQDQTLH